jgi:hypothetical protein
MRRRTLLWLGLVVVPFGPLELKLARENPWKGFDAQEANLLVIQARSLGPESGLPMDCGKWLDAMRTLPEGGQPWDSDLSRWSPWDSEARAQVSECDRFPCDVKLDEPEVKRLAASAPEKRQGAFLKAVQTRTQAYLSSGARPEMEWPGPRVDPWEYFTKRGLVAALVRPAVADLRVRILDISPGRMKPVRQILDRRSAGAAQEAVLWVRDVYSDHYFDGWGEFHHAACRPGSVELTSAVFVELDLLKQTDLLSRLGRPRARGVVEAQGHQYLDRAFEAMKASLQKSAVKQPQ